VKVHSGKPAWICGNGPFEEDFFPLNKRCFLIAMLVLSLRNSRKLPQLPGLVSCEIQPELFRESPKKLGEAGMTAGVIQVETNGTRNRTEC